MTFHLTSWHIRWPLLTVVVALWTSAAAFASPLSGPCTLPSGWWQASDPGREPVAGHAVLTRAAAAGIVLLGEQHDDADHHRWQAQVLAGLLALRPDLVIGFEMFPRRVQPALDRWVAGELTVAALLAQTGWEENWNLPIDLYLPLFEFARINRLPMIALNVDATLTRASASRVGTISPSTSARASAAQRRPARPIAITCSPSTARMRTARGARNSRAFQYFVEAQQNWDRAMAEALAGRRVAGPQGTPPLVVGIIGSGHLRHGFGVPHQLRDLGVDRVVTLLPLSPERWLATRFARVLRRHSSSLPKKPVAAVATPAPRHPARRRRGGAGGGARPVRHRRQPRRAAVAWPSAIACSTSPAGRRRPPAR
jgi:uncharacterized iron-regulated protein